MYELRWMRPTLGPSLAMASIAVVALVPASLENRPKPTRSHELAQVLAEITVREEQYRSEHSSYLGLPACPASPSEAGRPAATCADGAHWRALRIDPAETALHCSYQVVAGTGAGTNNPAGFRWTSPPESWFYLLATCDTGVTYFVSSHDAMIQRRSL